MRRRDLSKLLIASAGAGLAADAASPPLTQDTLSQALQRSGYVRISDGTYRTMSKLQTLTQNTIIGESRQHTTIQPGSFEDYVFEVGDGRSTPNAGLIQRLRFYGAAGNRGCLHMNVFCHMWRLEELVFSGGPCPALVVDDCWDSNYTNIDIFAHVSSTGDPSQRASVIFGKGCNNIYCRGLRIEGARSGGIYADSGPIYVVTGKIDDGAQGPQSAAAVTVTPRGFLVLDDFYLGGMLNQFHIDVSGTLKLGTVFLDGGTNSAAAIYDHRAWSHIDAQSVPGVADAWRGPVLPVLDIGRAQFRRFHVSLKTETPAAIYSRIHPIRQVENLAITHNGPATAGTITVHSNLDAAHDDLYKNSFLVHNPTGTQITGGGGARRKILRSFADGTLTLHGIEPVLVDHDWSIEYCNNHCTPLRYHDAVLDPEQSLFAVVSTRAVMRGSLSYTATPHDPAYGTTKFHLEGRGLKPGQDLRGLFLLDEDTGEPFYIQYGLDDDGQLGVLYDLRESLRPTHTFSVVAGYAADLELRGDIVAWRFAGAEHRVRLSELQRAGYSSEQVPLWAYVVGDGGALERVSAATSPIVPDLANARQWEITAEDARDFTIAKPRAGLARAGQRLSLTIRNGSPGTMGTVTWSDAYRLGAWRNPAAGHNRTIEFRFDGERWIEIARTEAEIPN
jgi:hypothetical protein